MKSPGSAHPVGNVTGPTDVAGSTFIEPTTTLDVAKYLDRIGYAGPKHPSATVLCDIHRHHMLSVPFENLDIMLRRPIVCSEEASVGKVVDRRRGGFCYELNGAFSSLLRALGFAVTLLSARVRRDDGSTGPDFDHLTLRVDLEEPWLADVGFGDGFLEPLRLKTGVEQLQRRRTFRLAGDGALVHLEMREPDAAAWDRQYSFTQRPRELSEFAAMCDYHQTSPDSGFTRESICSRATPDGRITLTDRELIRTRAGIKTASPVVAQEQRLAVLLDEFGIVL